MNQIVLDVEIGFQPMFEHLTDRFSDMLVKVKVKWSGWMERRSWRDRGGGNHVGFGLRGYWSEGVARPGRFGRFWWHGVGGFRSRRWHRTRSSWWWNIDRRFGRILSFWVRVVERRRRRMQGKGGKEWPPSKGKSALKAPTSEGYARKGKTKAGNYEAIEFESPENSESEGFIDEVKTPFSSKSAEKGEKGSNKKFTSTNLKNGDKGKTFNVAKDGKNGQSGKLSGKGKLHTGVLKVPMEVDAKLQIELPKNSEIIMDCEAATILQGIQDYLPVLTRDSSLKMPISFTKAHQLANNGDHYTDVESVKEILAKLKSKGVTDGEICMISRVCPETTDEIFALIPSLKEKIGESIKETLVELSMLKKYMQS